MFGNRSATLAANDPKASHDYFKSDATVFACVVEYGGASRHSGFNPESRVFNWFVEQRRQKLKTLDSNFRWSGGWAMPVLSSCRKLSPR